MPLTAKAYAKINLFLDITGKREDGYHELDSIFQAVSLYDTVSLSLCEKDITVVCDNSELSGESNIVYKACKLFFEDVGYNGGVNITISKNIPVAAGLAGGSADAAATLWLLNIALNAGKSIDQLSLMALKLGADVPFCLVGGTARVKGIGEKIQTVNTPLIHYVLLKEKEKQSTGKMFAKIDETDYETTQSIEEMLEGLNTSTLSKVSNNLFNAFSFCWEFDELTAPFAQYKNKGVFLSGSGPTVCAIFESEEEAVGCANQLKSKGLNAFYAYSVNCGVEVV
ncbi:MAG: 4-(cytidine 5'-diphospho)-2-C-methyl-D-erythritol kinase [Clostridia bacterium]|nr:4-(cytidine 5'-diphospho)-2-C-methyl-D-erythritol kinase [Clostridia bacterium]